MLISYCLALGSSCSSEEVRLGDGRADQGFATSGAAGSGGAGAGSAGAGSGGDTGGDAGSAGSGAGAGAGGGVTLPPFMEPAPIDDLAPSEATIDDPAPRGDRMELFFNVEFPDESEDIWSTVRSSDNEDWAEGAPVDELNTEDRETGIALSRDGLTIWFSTDRDEPGQLDVYTATRTTTEDAWENIGPVPELNTAGDDLVSSVSVDGLTFVLARRASADTEYDVYFAERSGTEEPWQEPYPIEGTINTPDGKEADASLVGDGLTLLFGRNDNLYQATRATHSDPFTGEVKIDELNSPADERDGWATPDFGYIIFSSDRENESLFVLYEAYRAVGQ